MSGTVAVGGEDWLVVNASGWLDTAADSAGLEVEHSGGWSPLDGPLASSFVTPRFDGTLSITNGSASFSAAVEWEQPLVLLAGLITLPSGSSSTAGPSLMLYVAGSSALCTLSTLLPCV